MLFLRNLAAVVALTASLAGAAPLAQEAEETTQQASYKKRAQRKAWHTLKDIEKAAWIKAELCLMKLPSKTGYPGAVTRWDDLASGHIQYVNVAHDVGAFLPWHRLFLHAHSEVLRKECNYEGVFPYWDQPKDIGRMEDSSLFDVKSGFGGNGQGEDSCVVDGPFANMTLNLGPGYAVSKYCLNRNFTPSTLELAARPNVDECYRHDNHVDMTFCMENNPHIAGHGAIGGVQLDVIASPGDPLFWMIHSYVDKLWWDWQKMDLDFRLQDMGGRNVPTDAYRAQFGLRAVTEEWLARDGDVRNVTTLNHVLDVGGVYPAARIADVMDIRCDFLNYEYV